VLEVAKAQAIRPVGRGHPVEAKAALERPLATGLREYLTGGVDQGQHRQRRRIGWERLTGDRECLVLPDIETEPVFLIRGQESRVDRHRRCQLHRGRRRVVIGCFYDVGQVARDEGNARVREQSRCGKGDAWQRVAYPCR
jgi:hypothetical protein